MRRDDRHTDWILFLIGLPFVVWAALLAAPYCKGGLPELFWNMDSIINHPFDIQICEDTKSCVLFLLSAYALAFGAYLSTRKNYRRGEEYGSAKWGDVRAVNRKYRNRKFAENKILTNGVRISLDVRKHFRNLNTLVIGGSGAGKTRYYCKPNVLNANTSLFVLDPKGEILRDTGNALKRKGYRIRVLDLINMDKSHCYNPFCYLRTDNDVQRLVTNLFKSTTQKGT